MSWIDQRPDDAMDGAFTAVGPDIVRTIDPAEFREAMSRLGAAVRTHPLIIDHSPLDSLASASHPRVEIREAERPPCGTDGTCAVHGVFTEARTAMLDRLSMARLEDLKLAN